MPDVPDLVNEECWEEDRPSAPVFTLVASKVASRAGRHPQRPERSYRSWYATWQPWRSSRTPEARDTQLR